MPLLASIYVAYATAAREPEHEQLASFVENLTLHLPLAFVLAFMVYVLVTLAGMLLSRLRGSSFAATEQLCRRC
jgi:hypothetical protein